eukprot:TRINITY_DN11078_c0_g1_i1.p1 TRINITY_DN11078_c0_g1~~TRINITY_DN11078_c0_g1_i1.p1  ORF type:complete len:1134 (+),score=123.20 TRINITY_DN11078_c0_g1_i1:36-3404(+)
MANASSTVTSPAWRNHPSKLLEAKPRSILVRSAQTEAEFGQSISTQSNSASMNEQEQGQPIEAWSGIAKPKSPAAQKTVTEAASKILSNHESLIEQGRDLITPHRKSISDSSPERPSRRVVSSLQLYDEPSDSDLSEADLDNVQVAAQQMQQMQVNAIKHSDSQKALLEAERKREQLEQFQKQEQERFAIMTATPRGDFEGTVLSVKQAAYLSENEPQKPLSALGVSAAPTSLGNAVLLVSQQDALPQKDKKLTTSSSEEEENSAVPDVRERVILDTQTHLDHDIPVLPSVHKEIEDLNKKHTSKIKRQLRRIKPVTQQQLLQEHLGQRVMVDNYGLGTLRYMGTTEFDEAREQWLGIELDQPKGKNDGTILGTKYFSCRMNHGIFVQQDSGTVRLAKADDMAQVPVAPRGRPLLKTAWGSNDSSHQTQKRDARPLNPRHIAVVSALNDNDNNIELMQDTEQNTTVIDVSEQASISSMDSGSRQALSHLRAQLNTAVACPQPTSELYDTEDSEDDLPKAVKQSSGKLDSSVLTQALIQLGLFDPEAVPTTASDKPKMTSLHRAAFSGNTNRVRRLLSRQELDIDVLDQYGRTPLMHAAHCNHLDTVDCLIKFGAKLDHQEPARGSTALHDAAFQGNALMLLLLIQGGANAMAADNEGRLALHWATRGGAPDSIDILLQSCPQLDINVTDEAGMTPLMWAAYNNAPKMIKRLLKLGAELNEKDIDGKTAMHWAVHADSVTCLKMIITHDATFFRDAIGKTLSHTAAELNASAALRLLHRLRPDTVFDLDKNDRTPLHWAATCGCANAVKELLRLGASPAARDRRDACPRDYVQAKRLTWKLDDDQQQAMDLCNQLLANQSVVLEDDTSVIVPHTHALPWESRSQVSDTMSSISRIMNTLNSVGKGIPSTHTADPPLPLLAQGTVLYKIGQNGQAEPRQKFFWLDENTGSLCWSNSQSERSTRSIKAKISGITMGPNRNVVHRQDYKAKADFYKASFSVSTSIKDIVLVASSMKLALHWYKSINMLLDRLNAKTNDRVESYERPPLQPNPVFVKRPAMHDARSVNSTESTAMPVTWAQPTSKLTVAAAQPAKSFDGSLKRISKPTHLPSLRPQMFADPAEGADN